MKRYISGSSTLSELFLKYHDSAVNYRTRPEAFDRVYKILDKYGNENEPVDVVFDRATPEEQQKMLNFLRPDPTDDSHRMYFSASSGDTKDTAYGQGVLDIIKQLIEDEYLDAEEWYQ